MREGDIKLFASKPLLYQVVNLRLNGYATKSMAILFHCHRSSIESQLERYGVVYKGVVFTIERITSDVLFRIVPPEPKWREVDGEKISQGKSYKEYLKESQLHRSKVRM